MCLQCHHFSPIFNDMIYQRITRLPSRYNTGLLKGLRAIYNLLRLVHRVLIYDGGRAFRTEDGIDVWPVKRFIELLQTDRIWPWSEWAMNF